MSTLIVIAKAPVPGRVKTRLTPEYTHRQAARIAEASLMDTLLSVREASADTRLLILDGDAEGEWLPPGFTVIPQIAGGLDRRLAAAFEEAARADPGPALLIGMDTPQVTPTLLDACRPHGDEEAVIGPARDGGFWALGFQRPREVRFDEILFDVPMSQPDTGGIQLNRLHAAGLRTRILPVLRDVDTAEDARVVATQCPDGHFARLIAVMSTTAPSRDAVQATAGIGARR